ncbi:tetraacyldisaccharide 4'-kinase [Verrucomicrobiota bacterium]
MRQKPLEKVERYLVALIREKIGRRRISAPEKGLLWTLKQLSRIYWLVVQTRLFLYSKSIFRPHTLGCQVISVGNLTVGGTGKTPVVEVFARELAKEGRKVAILSRGYKKEEPPFLQRAVDKILFRELRRPPRVVSDGNKLLLNSAMSGDEPYMLASNLPDVAVLVDKNRVKSGRYAINRLGCDTLVLDDGFQYLSLRHRVEIVLVDRTSPFGNEEVLPRGLLREPVKNIRRANFIFITKSNGRGTKTLKDRIRKLNPHAEITECRHCARHLRNVYSSEQLPLSFLKGKKIIALSGIAAPRGFERELEARGAKIVQKNRFVDHHRYGQQEIIDIINEAQKLGADAIITTEKDAVRFPRLRRRDIPIYFLRVDIEMLSGAEDFRQCISRICFRETE